MDLRVRRSILPLGLTWLAFVVRVYHLTYQSLWRDEVDTMLFATRSLPELLEMFRKPGENGPLFFLALRPWLAAAGTSEFALRFPSALAGALAVPMLYVLVRRLVGQRAASIAALLSTVAPYLVWYGQEAKMYALLTVAVPLSLWLTLEVTRRHGWVRWVVLYVVTTLSFYAHVLAALVIPLQAVWLVVACRNRSLRRRIAEAAIYLVALILPYSPMIWWQAKLWLSPTFKTGLPFVPLSDILTVLLVGFTRGILPVSSPLTLLPAVLGLFAGVGLWASNSPTETKFQKRSSIVLLSSWLLLPPILLYAVSLEMPIFADRYLIWVMPAYLALIATGIVALYDAWRPLGFLTLGACLALNLAGIWNQTSQPIKADMRGAAQYVMAAKTNDDLLVFQIPYNRFAFTYYAGDDFQWLDGPYTNNGMAEAEFGNHMAEDVADHGVIWLVSSEASMWDDRDLTGKWLAAHFALDSEIELSRVTVYRYVAIEPEDDCL